MNSIEEKKEDEDNEEIENKEKEENEINIPKYNPEDDKYENFNIAKIKKLKTFNFKLKNKNIEIMLVLQDRRILLVSQIERSKY